jgi:dienelactone hydrolase
MVNKPLLAGLLFFAAVLLGQAPVQVPMYKDRQHLLVYLDESGHPHPATSVAQWEIRRAHILDSMQLVMGPLPAAEVVPLDLQIEATEELPSVRRQRITFRSEGEDRVPAYLLIPKGLAYGAKVPAVLCLHETTPLGKSEPAGWGEKTNLHYALELAERGYVTLAPDYPNFGDYKFDAYAHGFSSASMKGIVNHRRAVDLLRSLPQVDPERIAVIGHSLGGHNALFIAAFDPRIKAVVTSCGFTSFAKYKEGDLTGWSHKGYMPRIAEVYGKDPKRMPFDFTEVLAALAPRPVFINAPLGDDNFAVSGVRDCVASARVVYQTIYHAGGNLHVVYPAGGHDFPPQARQAAYEFLAQSLGYTERTRQGQNR